MSDANIRAVIARYATEQFRHYPVRSIAKLMGLDAYLPEIQKNKALVYPILCGIIMYRCLDETQKMAVMRQIWQLPRGPLFSRLYSLPPDIVANPYWFCWDLSDDELRAFFKESKHYAEIFSWLGGTNALPTLTVPGIAAFLYKSIAKKSITTVVTESAATTVMRPAVASAFSDIGPAGSGLAFCFLRSMDSESIDL